MTIINMLLKEKKPYNKCILHFLEFYVLVCKDLKNSSYNIFILFVS